MRVAIVGDYPVGHAHVQGGVQAAFVYLVKGLQQLDDLQVHIITRRGNSQAKSDEIEQGRVVVHVLPDLPRFELPRRYRTYQSQLRSTLAAIRPDVVHAQGTNAHGYVALRSGYPAVITAHGIRSEDAKYVTRRVTRWRDQLEAFMIERDTLRHTGHLIAISRYVTTYFSAVLQPTAQVYYIPNAIDARYLDLPDVADGQTVLFAGRVLALKRVLDLVKAFEKVARQLPRAQLRIAGECQTEPSYVQAVRAYIREAGLNDRVHLLGHLAQEAILREFAACDVLALSSAQENAPMVIAQALAAGKPVVATAVGGVTEMVSPGETGFLVPVGDVGGLANALLELLQNPALRARMGQAARQCALKNYEPEAVARRTYQAYQNVQATGRRA